MMRTNANVVRRVFEAAAAPTVSAKLEKLTSAPSQLSTWQSSPGKKDPDMICTSKSGRWENIGAYHVGGLVLGFVEVDFCT